jgi:hypothetical protein
MPMESRRFYLTVEAGPHERRHCPVSFILPDSLRADTWELRQADGSALPLQALPDGIAVFILPLLAAGAHTTLLLQQQHAPHGDRPFQVAVTNDSDSLSIAVCGTPLTRYHYAGVPARPYFYPLLTADGREVTRAYPMRTDVPAESQDHPHHRSLWIAYGDIDGVDNWSEASGHGSTRHDAVLDVRSGDVYGQFTTSSTWIASDRRPLLTQRLQVTAWATPPEFRLMDFTIDLTAVDAPVRFGDTKEGGILSVRVVGTMDVPRGGHIENSYGGLDEAETWGKAAHWCDYAGPVGNGVHGIAIMDHPLSFRYPTHWHIRNYGLMTANPFGYAAYTAGAKRGDHRLEKGENLHFRYRLLVHTGTAQEGSVRAQYLDFVSPPTAKIMQAEQPFRTG